MEAVANQLTVTSGNKFCVYKCTYLIIVRVCVCVRVLKFGYLSIQISELFLVNEASVFWGLTKS